MMEKEFFEYAKIIKYEILRRRMINYYNDLSQISPSIFSAEDKYQHAIKKMTLDQLEKLAENAWQDEVEQLEKNCLQNN